MAVVKTVGNSGQISLGKKFAGQHVLVDEIEERMNYAGEESLLEFRKIWKRSFQTKET